MQTQNVDKNKNREESHKKLITVNKINYSKHVKGRLFNMIISLNH